MIFSDSPHYIHTNSYVYDTHTRAWRLHRDPWWPCDHINIIICLLSTYFFFVCVLHHYTHPSGNLCQRPLWPADDPPTGQPTPGHPGRSWSAQLPLVRAPPPKRSPQDYDGWCHTGTTPARMYNKNDLYVDKWKFIWVPRITLYSFVRTEKWIDYKSMRCCWTLYVSLERTEFWPFPAERPPTVPNTLWAPQWSPNHHKWCH